MAQEEEIKILRDEVQKLKKKLRNQEYGLIWEDKPEQVVEDCKSKIPILEEVKNKRVVTDKTKPMNLLIEGDNFHALSVLNYTHKGKISVIYIDPPYNTGAQDWKYNNDYVDENDQWRHSKWVSMMNHRLRIARNLLSESGIFFCAIDHYELFSLGLLCDEIFGESNRLAVITVVHKPEGRQFANFFSPSNEFMLVYAKNKSEAHLNEVIIDEEQKERFDERDELGSYRLKNFIRLTDGKYSLRKNAPDGYYPIYVSKDMKSFSIENKKGFKAVYPITNRGIERTWKTLKDTFMEKVESGSIVAKLEEGQITIYEKLREDEVIKTHWIRKEYHSYHFGTKILEDILGPKKFNFPKSLNLLIDILKLSTNKDSIVMDFFAGSGTTGHAVLEMNKQDGGNRKFILATDDENGIAEQICYKRIKKVIDGYTGESSKNKINGLGGNLEYQRCKFVDSEKLDKMSDEARVKLTYKTGEMIALRENAHFEEEKNEWWQLFTDAEKDKWVGIYFKEDKSRLNELIDELSKKKNAVVYIFGWGKNEYKNSYPEFPMIRVEDIPEPIIEVYREINKILE